MNELTGVRNADGSHVCVGVVGGSARSVGRRAFTKISVNAPVYGQLAVGLQELVGLAEVPAAEEPTAGAEARGVSRREHVVLPLVNHLALLLRVAAAAAEVAAVPAVR